MSAVSRKEFSAHAKQRGLSVKRQRDVPMPLFQFLEVARDQADQIVDMRLFLKPVHALQAVWLAALAHQPTVRQDGHARGDVADHFGARSFIRVVKTREPESCFVGFPLRPDMGIAFRVAHLRRAEIEAANGFRRVLNFHPSFLPRQYLSTKGHQQLTSRVGELGHVGVRANRDDLQVDGVQHKLLERV